MPEVIAVNIEMNYLKVIINKTINTIFLQVLLVAQLEMNRKYRYS